MDVERHKFYSFSSKTYMQVQFLLSIHHSLFSLVSLISTARLLCTRSYKTLVILFTFDECDSPFCMAVLYILNVG